MTLSGLGRLPAVFCLTIGLGACAAAPGKPPSRELDVPYVPTSWATVTTMLRMADAGPGDVLYDLGSGDGRIVIAAVRDFGVSRGVGVDLNPARVAEARAYAVETGVADRVRFVEGDVFKFDFSEATVVTMYLLEHINLQLRPKVLALRPGTRVVSHQFTMGDWEPDEWRRESETDIDVMFWIVPARVAGAWQWGGNRLEISQKYQNISGTLQAGGRAVEIERATLIGDRIAFSAPMGGADITLEGKVLGDTIEATVNGARVTIRRVR